MGRGLGKIQQQILDTIKSGDAIGIYTVIDSDSDKYLRGLSCGTDYETKTDVAGGFSFTQHKPKGWTDVEYLMWYVVNGANCFSRADPNEAEDIYDPDFKMKEPTEVDKQSIWRAIRQLEKRRLIESRMFPIYWEDRLMNRSEHRQNFHDKCKPGCANKQKAIRLVQQVSLVN